MKLIFVSIFCAICFSKAAFAQVDAESLSKDNQVPAEAEMKPEEAPPPEAPYPNAPTQEATPPPPPAELDTPAPRTLPSPTGKPRTLGVPQRIPPKEKQRPLNLEKPKKVDENGNYIYEKSTETDQVDVSKKVVPPHKVGKEGPLKITKPLEIRKNGDYFYGYEVTPHDRATSIKFALFPPLDLKNKDNGNSYKTLYTNQSLGAFLIDYEKQYRRSYGYLGLRFGTGVYFAQGSGRFVNTQDTERDSNTIPDVKFSMILFPNTVTALYHFRYSDKQIFSPYFGGGGGLFAFTEIRDDGLSPKFGGAAVGVLLGGINILFDGIEASASRELETSYGVSHVSLNIEFTQHLGLNSYYDFTSSVISAGFNLEF